MKLLIPVRWPGIGLLMVLFFAQSPAHSSEMLGKLPCAFLFVEDVREPGPSLGVTYNFLLAALKVGVTENLPRLSLDDSCGSDLYLNVTIVDTEGAGGRPGYYSATVRLEVRRMAEVLENGYQGMVTVWDSSSLLIGHTDDLKNSLMETIREMAAEFGREFRGAGNP